MCVNFITLPAGIFFPTPILRLLRPDVSLGKDIGRFPALKLQARIFVRDASLGSSLF
jgi:hypothetical protein